MAQTLTLYGAAGVTNVTPLFTFSAGTVKVYVADAYVKDLVSGVEDNIALSVGQKLEYVISDENATTRIDIGNDKVSGDISGWILSSALTYFYVNSTSVSGDISGWILPSTLLYFRAYSTSVSGDISGWTLPSDLVVFYIRDTSVSGDISGWTLPPALAYFVARNTLISGDISGWTLPPNMFQLYLYGTQLDYDFSTGAFTGITSSLDRIDLDNCSLIFTQVDNILADLVTSGVTGKTLEIAGNNSYPSPAGLLNKAILESRGWTISANSLAPTDPTLWAWIEELIEEKGRALTITLPGDEADAGKPWRGNTAGTPTDAIGVFVQYRAEEIDNDHIKRADQKVLLIPDEAVDIEEGTKIVDSLDNSSWTVQNIEKFTSRSDILLYILQIRQ